MAAIFKMQTRTDRNNPTTEYNFATRPSLRPIPTNSDFVWHISSLNNRYPSTAVFVTPNSLLGLLYFSLRDDRGHLVISVDEDGQQTLSPRPNVFKHRLSLLSESTTGSPWIGRPMGYDVTISTCERPPRFLYRAIHNEYAGNGLEARGMNVVTLDALNFQIHLENHLQPCNPSLSPFLSTISDRNKAVRRCQRFIREGRTGVQLLRIDTQNPRWEHKNQRLWNLQDVIPKFGLEWKQFYTDEYLIERFIPWETVTRFDWSALLEKGEVYNTQAS